MAKQSLDESINMANKQYGGPSQYLKLKDGDNLVRLLTPLEVVGKHFLKQGYKGICIGKEEGCEGCKYGDKPSAKWIGWAYAPEKWGDQIVNELRLVEFGYKILTQLRDLQKDDEYGFEEFPMPYAVNIKTSNAGTTNVTYTVMPRKETPLDEKMMEELTKKTPVPEIIEAMKEKRGKGAGEHSGSSEARGVDYPTDDINPDDIPF